MYARPSSRACEGSAFDVFSAKKSGCLAALGMTWGLVSGHFCKRSSVCVMVEDSPRDCLICRIVHGTERAHAVWEDARHVAFLDVNPMAPGHTALAPRSHARTVYELAPDDFAELF